MFWPCSPTTDRDALQPSGKLRERSPEAAKTAGHVRHIVHDDVIERVLRNSTSTLDLQSPVWYLAAACNSHNIQTAPRVCICASCTKQVQVLARSAGYGRRAGCPDWSTK